VIRILFLVLVISGIAGCSAQALKEINKEPELSPMDIGYAGGGDLKDGGSYTGEPPHANREFSLWRDRQSRLFTDPRALDVGDILTVRIEINDRARFKNESERNRTSTRSLGGGLSAEFQGASVEGSADADISSGTESSGTGATTRSEDIELLVAAVVIDVLPNGNLIIQGSQEVRVNAELRILTMGGIVRPSDIESDNTISYERIAEARIAYGGRGRLTEVQQPPYGQQFLDHVLPF
jgi:flagellar L-ring protein precursor FlgH